MRLYRDSDLSNAIRVFISTITSIAFTKFSTSHRNGYISVEWDTNLDEEVSYIVTDNYTNTSKEIDQKSLELELPIGTVVKVTVQAKSPYYGSTSRTVTLVALDKGIGVMVVGSTFFIGDQPNQGIGSTNFIVGSTLIIA